MQIEGRVVQLKSPETNGGLTKQTIAIEDAHKTQIAIDFLGENIKLLENIGPGDEVIATFVCKINTTVDGKMWNRISGKSIEKIAG